MIASATVVLQQRGDAIVRKMHSNEAASHLPACQRFLVSHSS
jgi:hypothetical protein